MPVKSGYLFRNTATLFSPLKMVALLVVFNAMKTCKKRAHLRCLMFVYKATFCEFSHKIHLFI